MKIYGLTGNSPQLTSDSPEAKHVRFEIRESGDLWELVKESNNGQLWRPVASQKKLIALLKGATTGA